MLINGWNPFHELDQLRREVDTAFQRAGVGPWDRPVSRAAFLPGRAARSYPLINMAETPDALQVEALAPGVEAKSFDVSVVGDTLTIAGEKANLAEGLEAEATHRSERATGKFVRTVPLPMEIEADKVKADYRDGLLVITLPKAETAKPKQIQVSVG